jgi:MtaA/CmuA family methyltransferase
MNSYERVMSRLHGELVDRAPNFNILMAYAARHNGTPLSRFYLDYRVLCQANLAVLRAFSLDLVGTMSDPYGETADWGAAIVFPEDGLPVCTVPLLQRLEDIRKLPSPEPTSGRRMSNRLHALRFYRDHVGGEVPILGWVEGALAEAANLRGVSRLMVDLYDNPEPLEEVLERCTEVAIAFARAQVHAGADIVGVGDAVGSQISPGMYERFALPYEQRIFGAIHESGAVGRLHICGNTSKILRLMAQSGADIVDIDWMVDMQAARVACEGKSVCGNFDPVAVMLRGTPDLVRQSVHRSLDLGGPRCFSMAGCEIPEGTPAANLLAHAEALREFGPG